MKKTICMILSFILVTALAILAGYGVYRFNNKKEPKKEEKIETKPTDDNQKIDEKQNELITDATACEKFKSYTSNESDNSFIYDSCSHLYDTWELIENNNREIGFNDIHNNDNSRITNKVTSDFESYAKRFARYLIDQIRPEDSDAELYLLEIYLNINEGDMCISKKAMQEIGVELFGVTFDINEHLNSKFISDNYYCVEAHQAYVANPASINAVSKEETSDKATITVDVKDSFTIPGNYRLKVNFNIKNDMYVYDSYEIVNN